MPLPMNLLVRRRQEDNMQRAQAAVAELRKDTNIVEFAHRSERGVQRTLVRQRIAQANERVRAACDARRARLASLLESEKSQYESEIAATFETPEQVKEKLLKYAREIKEQRESARRALAEELELRRFKAGSDALRARTSALLTEKTGLDRVAQLQEKARIAAMQLSTADEEARAMAANVAAEEARVRALEFARRDAAAKQSHLLDTQVAAIHDLKSRERAAEDAAVARLLEADRAAAAAQVEAARVKRATGRSEFERIQEFNAREKGIKDSMSGAEAANDKAALEATLAREASEAAREAALKEAKRRDALAYRAKLESTMGRQGDERSALDAAYSEEMERQWGKRQAQWDAEAAARRQLTLEAAEGQREQMAERERQRGVGGMDDAQLAKWRQDMADADAKENMRLRARQEAMRREAEFLKEQMEANAAKKAQEKQEEYLAFRQAQQFEKAYKEKVQHLLKTEAGPWGGR